MRSRDELYEGLNAAGGLRAVARRLGRWCLPRAGTILDELARFPAARSRHSDLQTWVADAPIPWDGANVGRDLREWLEGSAADESVRLLDGNPGVAAHAVLAGTCQRPLRRWFASTTVNDVRIEYGDPVPVVVRTYADHAGMTPSLPALLRGTLLGNELYRIYDRQAPDVDSGPPYLQVSLDFSDRVTLDEATWDAAGQRPPDMATVHPHAPAAFDLSTVQNHVNEWWFGVTPDPCDIPRIIDGLAVAKDRGAWCAVLPEVSLPFSRALSEQLADRNNELPRVVVAGSAHERHPTGPDAEERANRSVVYLDGGELFHHDKTHPFYTDVFSQDPKVRMPEGINTPRRLVIASGDTTRLAVVICADLHAEEVLSALVQLCVNLLLVPALTPDEGAFARAAANVAANQGLSLMANGTMPGDLAPARPAFLNLVGVPRADPGHQIIAWRPADGLRQVVCVVRPWTDQGVKFWHQAI